MAHIDDIFSRYDDSSRSHYGLDYTVVGRDEDGNTLYYTGRAGQAFVSNQLCDAFTYASLEGARRRATNLNQMTAIHGIRFFVPVGEQA